MLDLALFRERGRPQAVATSLWQSLTRCEIT